MLAETFAESSIEVVPDADARSDAGPGGNAAVAIENEDAIDDDEREHPVDLEVAVHTGRTDEYRDVWIVVHRPPEPTASDAISAALVCLEREPRIWDGFRTFDPERVVELDEYVATKL